MQKDYLGVSGALGMWSRWKGLTPSNVPEACRKRLATMRKTPMDMAGRLNTAEAAVRYITAGRAKITLRSTKTQDRYTYRIRAAKKEQYKGLLFVDVLTGGDDKFAPLGVINSKLEYFHARRSKIAKSATSAVAMEWSWNALARTKRLPRTLEVWHEGRCGKCGKELTVPESIASGFGPKCLALVGG